MAKTETFTSNVDIMQFYAARNARLRLRRRNLIRSSCAVACGLCLTAAALAHFLGVL